MAESESFDDRKSWQVWVKVSAMQRGQRLLQQLWFCNAVGAEGPVQPLAFGINPGHNRPQLSAALGRADFKALCNP